MIFSRKHKYVFYRMPRTGSTAVSTALLEQYDGMWYGPAWSHNQNDLENSVSFCKFCVVRHPYNRIHSYFKKQIEAKLHLYGQIHDMCFNSFIDFIVDKLPTDKSRFLLQSPFYFQLPKLDKVLQYENLTTQLHTLSFVGKITLPQINTSVNTETWSEVLDQEHKVKLQKFARPDFETWPDFWSSGI